MSVPPLTTDRVRQVLDYAPLTGIFTWKIAHKRIGRGQIAGSLDLHGYQKIGLDGKIYSAHRLAWLYIHGIFPPQHLDHINGDRADNRLVNLRLCDRFLNQQNRSLSGSGATGYLGVSFNKNAQKFAAEIRYQGFRKHLGIFHTAFEAHEAYMAAKKILHQSQGRR